MDIVKLAIVYDTQQAAAKVQELDARLNQLQARTTQATTAAQGFTGGVGRTREAVRRLAEETLGVHGTMGRFSTGLLSTFGGPWALGIAAGIGAIALAFRKMGKEAEESQKVIVDSVQRMRKALGAFVEDNANLVGQAILTRRIAEAEANASAMRQLGAPGVGDVVGMTRGQGVAGLFAGLIAGLAGVSRAQTGYTTSVVAGDLKVSSLRQALIDLNEVMEETARIAEQKLMKALREFTPPVVNVSGAPGIPNTAAAWRMAFPVTEAGPAPAGGVDTGRRWREFFKIELAAEATAAKMGEGIDDLKRAMEAATQHSVLFENGLFTMANAIEDFVITGTFAFEEFLNNILRMLYRDFTTSLIDDVLGGLSSVGGSRGTASRGAASADKISKINPSLQTNVTFNVTAIDAQGTAQFFERNAPILAQRVAAEADRSRAIRRRWARG